VWRRRLVAPSHRSWSSRQIEHLNVCWHSVDLCRPLGSGTQANYTKRVGGTRDEIERCVIRSWKEHDDLVCLDTLRGDKVGGLCIIDSLRHDESDAMSRRRIPTSRQGRIVPKVRVDECRTTGAHLRGFDYLLQRYRCRGEVGSVC
jgi:hypothetical protein